MAGPMTGQLTPNPPVNTGSGPDVVRPMPTDPPGARDAAGWVKTDASGPGGWDAIDEAADQPGPWRQC
jgi:hypothetical protein